LTQPTTSYDEALEQYENKRKIALDNAREDLELEDGESIEDNVNIFNLEVDHTCNISYLKNGSVQETKIAIHVWDVELEEKPSRFVLIGVDGNYRTTARTFDEAKTKAKELAEYGYSEVVEVIDTVTQKCVFKYERD
jgi:hypothetical protein